MMLGLPSPQKFTLFLTCTVDVQGLGLKCKNVEWQDVQTQFHENPSVALENKYTHMHTRRHMLRIMPKLLNYN